MNSGYFLYVFFLAWSSLPPYHRAPPFLMSLEPPSHLPPGGKRLFSARLRADPRRSRVTRCVLNAGAPPHLHHRELGITFLSLLFSILLLLLLLSHLLLLPPLFFFFYYCNILRIKARGIHDVLRIITHSTPESDPSYPHDACSATQ